MQSSHAHSFYVCHKWHTLLYSYELPAYIDWEPK